MDDEWTNDECIGGAYSRQTVRKPKTNPGEGEGEGEIGGALKKRGRGVKGVIGTAAKTDMCFGFKFETHQRSCVDPPLAFLLNPTMSVRPGGLQTAPFHTNNRVAYNHSFPAHRARARIPRRC